MEILPTLALVPGAPVPPETIASGGDDPFLALLAGLMQQPAQPAAPVAIAIEPGGDSATTAPAALGRAPAALPPTPLVATSAFATAIVAPDIGPSPPTTAAAPGSGPSREPPTTPASAIDPPPELPGVGEAAPMVPPSPSPDTKQAPPKAETAAPSADVRPKGAQVAHPREPGRPGEREASSGEPGEVPVPAIVAPANPAAAGEELAHSPDLDPADLVARVPEAGAAPVPATEARPADAPAVRQLPPVQLPTPDVRGRPVTARLVVVDGSEGSRVRINLEPADLGRVEVALRLDDSGAATASFIADRPETLQLLQRDARAVNEMLSAAGFTVDQGGLDFALRDPGGRDGGGERQPGTRGRADPEFGGDAAPSEPPPLYRRGLLDLRV